MVPATCGARAVPSIDSRPLRVPPSFVCGPGTNGANGARSSPPKASVNDSGATGFIPKGRSENGSEPVTTTVPLANVASAS